jgi:hypothetical protein
VCALPVPHSLAPPVCMFVYDHDKLSKDDTIGRLSIPISECASFTGPDGALKPRWIEMRTFDNRPGCGKLLVAVELLTPTQAQQRPFDAFVGGARALVTFICIFCIFCTLRTQIPRSKCNSTHYINDNSIHNLTINLQLYTLQGIEPPAHERFTEIVTLGARSLQSKFGVYK